MCPLAFDLSGATGLAKYFKVMSDNQTKELLANSDECPPRPEDVPYTALLYIRDSLLRKHCGKSDFSPIVLVHAGCYNKIPQTA